MKNIKNKKGDFLHIFLILRRPHENTKGKLCKYQWKFRLNECITGEIPKPTQKYEYVCVFQNFKMKH